MLSKNIQWLFYLFGYFKGSFVFLKTLCSSLQAIELIKHLAEANKYDIDSATTEVTIKLYQLLRVIPYEGLDTMWKKFAGNEQYRWGLGCHTYSHFQWLRPRHPITRHFAIHIILKMLFLGEKVTWFCSITIFVSSPF